MENLVGKNIGKFEVKEQVGQGGMATVYKAFDTTLQRTVALKTLFPNLAADSELLQRFHREAVTAANLKHPNIVTIYEVGSHEGQDYIVMEFLEGATLREEIQRLGSLPIPRVCKILTQLASALDYAHSHRLIHRDIKPGNVILGKDDHATLTDFGLVKASSGVQLTQAGATVGTLEYMSPEQVLGNELDHRSDIYSLGVLVYEMLTGQKPYRGRTTYEVLQGLIYEPPIPFCEVKPGIPSQVEKVVRKTLAKKPEDRYQSAGEMAQAFARAGESCADERESTSETPTPETGDRGWLLRSLGGLGEYPLQEGENSVGRVAGNDVIVAEAPVSRYHARITCTGSHCEVFDLGSTNGTYINNKRIEQGKRHILLPGDTLCLGVICFEVVYNPPSEESGFADKTMMVGLPWSPPD